MERFDFDKQLEKLFIEHEELVTKPNPQLKKSNGIYNRYEFPILTHEHAPIFWRYDLDKDSNPHLMERLGVNTTFNAGAIEMDGKYYIIARVESNDVKSFFAVAESPNGVDNFRFWDHPIVMPVTEDPEMNVYDIRLTKHEDGWIYGLFCAERKDLSKPEDSSAALATCGIARTKDLKNWERLADLKSNAMQQRNCVLHSEFVNGKYMIYTRPQMGFIDTGDSGICAGFADNMENAVIDEEFMIDPRQYHTYKEVKNGQGPAPLKTEKGWLHLAHGVRRTAAGLRYVLYMFMTSLEDPTKVIARPAGHLIAPHGNERVGDVSNVVFSNGWIQNDKGEVFIYYASSDTRMHVATTTIEKLLDYVMNTPEDAGRTQLCAAQRDKLVTKNLKILEQRYPELKKQFIK
ncbi:MAG: glycosidase [Marinifilaceae bacterium]